MGASLSGTKPDRRRLPRHPVLMGLTLSLVSTTLGCAALGVLRLTLPMRLWGGSASQSLIGAPALVIFFTAIVFAPLFETCIGQLLPIELARRCRANATTCILVSATVFGLGHFYSGGIASGVSTFVGGAVFAYAYMAARDGGVGASYVATATAHAGHNALLFYIVMPIFPD